MPSDGRRATIVGTPVSLPTRPATASSAEPMTLPTTVGEHRRLQPERGHEQAAGDEHQQADAEVAPEHAEVQSAERAPLARDGRDLFVRLVGR